MHFMVLSALPLPQDISAAEIAIPTNDVIEFAKRKLLMNQFSYQNPTEVLQVDTAITDSVRWECLVERMVTDLLAPYDKNSTDITYIKFNDRTDEGRTAYEQSGIDCVRTPNGRIITCHSYEFHRQYELHDGKVYKRWFGPLHHRKRTKKSKKYFALPNYPFRKLFPTAEAFMTQYCGCKQGKEAGRFGYYANPNGQWDWWQIGGRWPFQFLVKNDCALAVTGESYLLKKRHKRDAPEGYRWVAGARKCDVAWDVMREFFRYQYSKQFYLCEEWFTRGAIPKEYISNMRLAEDGLVSFGKYVYHKGEDLEHYLANLGLSDQNQYPILTFAYIDADGWKNRGWGASNASDEEKQAWHKAVSDFIAKQPDDTLLVSVDCRP